MVSSTHMLNRKIHIISRGAPMLESSVWRLGEVHLQVPCCCSNNGTYETSWQPRNRLLKAASTEGAQVVVRVRGRYYCPQLRTPATPGLATTLFIHLSNRHSVRTWRQYQRRPREFESCMDLDIPISLSTSRSSGSHARDHSVKTFSKLSFPSASRFFGISKSLVEAAKC